MAKFLDGAGLATLWEQIKNSGAKIAAGSYTGDGATAKSLTFDFVPKFIHVALYNGGLYGFTALNGMTRAHSVVNQTSSSSNVSLTWNGNTVKWSNSDTSNGLNSDGVTYYYCAIG